jgi:hypothetical protein
MDVLEEKNFGSDGYCICRWSIQNCFIMNFWYERCYYCYNRYWCGLKLCFFRILWSRYIPRLLSLSIFF